MKTIYTLLCICFTIVFAFRTEFSMALAGTTCATAWNIPLDSCTGLDFFLDDTIEGTTPAVSCTVFSDSEGWYSFIIPAGPTQNITITASDSYGSTGMAIQVIAG